MKVTVKITEGIAGTGATAGAAVACKLMSSTAHINSK